MDEENKLTLVDYALQYMLDEACIAFRECDDVVVFHDVLLEKVLEFCNENLTEK